MAEYRLVKKYMQHFGLDLKSSDLNRPTEFASGMRNAQYKKSGSIEKRKGYQGHAASTVGRGLFTYNKVNATTGAQEPEVIGVSNVGHKLNTATITVSYTGSDPTVRASLFYDTATSQYRFQLTEGSSTVLDYALGVGFDEASTVTMADLNTAIDALANFSTSTSGTLTGPAAFSKVFRDYDLASMTGADLEIQASYWTTLNSPSATPFAGSETNKNDLEFENATAVQINNVLYITNGYDEVQKYDGQNLYRAGLPTPASIATALVGSGSITGTNYLHLIQYQQKDAVGNIIEGNFLQSTTLRSPTAEDFDVTVANVLAASGFNTNCAVVDGGQTTVNTITVDDGAGGSATLKVGDVAYFYDSVSAAYVERNVTAASGSSITIDGAAVTVADNAVISNNLRINIFRSKSSGSTPTTFFLVDEIPNNSFSATQVYRDDTVDASLGAQFIEPLTDRSPPPKGRYISAFRNQMVIAGKLDDVDSVFYSDVLSPEYHPVSNNFKVETVSGDKITGIAPNNEVFAVFKTRSIYIVSGNIADGTIRVDQLTNDIGCAAHASIQEIRGSLYFLSDRGPYIMTGGQIPTPLGGNRIEPVFDQVGVPATSLFRLKRAIGVNDRDDEKYLLFLPAESVDTVTSDRYSNSNSRIYAYDYTREAFLEWTNMDFTGGATFVDGEFYFVERRLSTFTTNSVDHVLYRRHNINDAWDYQDNTAPIDWEYISQWEALGDPSVFKRYLRVRIFSLEELVNNELFMTVKTNVNYIADNEKANFNFEFGALGYGVSEYGVSAYGDPLEKAQKRKLSGGRFRSLRFRFGNNRDLENVALTGWELEAATPFRIAMKE